MYLFESQCLRLKHRQTPLILATAMMLVVASSQARSQLIVTLDADPNVNRIEQVADFENEVAVAVTHGNGLFSKKCVPQWKDASATTPILTLPGYQQTIDEADSMVAKFRVGSEAAPKTEPLNRTSEIESYCQKLAINLGLVINNQKTQQQKNRAIFTALMMSVEKAELQHQAELESLKKQHQLELRRYHEFQKQQAQIESLEYKINDHRLSVKNFDTTRFKLDPVRAQAEPIPQPLRPLHAKLEPILTERRPLRPLVAIPNESSNRHQNQTESDRYWQMQQAFQAKMDTVISNTQSLENRIVALENQQRLSHNFQFGPDPRDPCEPRPSRSELAKILEQIEILRTSVRKCQETSPVKPATFYREIPAGSNQLRPLLPQR
ncbi:MAG: hypothetical protein AAF623_05205 [Planctomycetota bacterium]